MEVAVERGGLEEVHSDHIIGTETLPSAQVSDSPDQDGSVGDPSMEEFPAVCVCVYACVCVCACVN